MEGRRHVEDGHAEDEEVAATVEESSNNTIPDRFPRTASTSTSTTTTTATTTTTSTDQLERCGRWLSSIPRDDVTVLRETPEYQEFLQAFERLGCAHRRVISCSGDRGNGGSGHSNSPPTTVASRGSAAVASVRSTNLSDKVMVSGSSANSINGDTDCVNSTVSHIMSVSSFADGSEMDAKIPAAISTSSSSQTTQSQQQRPSSRNVFTQHTDDVIVRMLEFLECQSLIRASTTCSRFQQLANNSAEQRTHAIAQSRQLCSVMQLLRAQEQIVEGDHYWNHSSTSASATGHVRVPMLLLGRRIVVTNAGDEDYNGTYYCTNANGNGFVFTKPRYPIVRVSAALRRNQGDTMEVDNNGNGNNPLPAPPHQQGLAAAGGNIPQLQQPHHHLAGAAAAIPQNDASISTRYDGESPQPGQPLRCIISKRYSNDRLLWYMSKEVETIDEDATQGSVVSETFHFWANLLILETATPDASRYPSQSSALTRQGGESWHSLSTAIRAPTVELMD